MTNIFVVTYWYSLLSAVLSSFIIFPTGPVVIIWFTFQEARSGVCSFFLTIHFEEGDPYMEFVQHKNIVVEHVTE